MNDTTLYGRNAVLEAIRAGRGIEKLYIAKGTSGGSMTAILGEARKRRILVQEVERDRLNELTEGGNHQGVVAACSAVAYADLEDIFKRAEERGESPLLLICESIQDPHNLGAILRTAEAAGVHGVVVSKHHAVGLTQAVAKTAAGALEHIPVVKVSSVAKLLDDLKKRGLWTACADMDGQNIYQTDLRGPMALVIGGEHEGISRLVKERCDYVVSLPMKGKVTSLNASVAAALFMYEVVRQRANL